MQKKKNDQVKIVLAGGHGATTAIATIQEILRRKNNWKVYWIGTKMAFEGKSIPTLESQFFSRLGVTFYPIISGRLQRKFSLWTIPSLVRIPIGFVHAGILLIKIRPKVILSFGGFAAFPVVVVGWLMRVPIVLHEQTSAAGLANKLSSPFAKKIAVSRKRSLEFFPKEKTVVVGNPLLASVAKVSPKEKMSSPPTIFITGGSRGSSFINSLLQSILPKLLDRFLVIHQTGLVDFRKFKNLKKNFTYSRAKRYQVYSTIDPLDIEKIYKQADIVVSRAGANTVSEIISTKRPAVLIPISWSYGNEQLKNAERAQRLGIAKVLNQEQATGKTLLDLINQVFKDWSKMVKSPLVKNLDNTASFKLVDILEEYA